MRKWIKYQRTLILIAWRNTAKKIEFFSTAPLQVFAILATALIVFLVRGYFGMDDFSFSNILVSLLVALAGYAIFNGIVFLYYFVRSPQTLSNGIGVHRYSELSIQNPKLIFNIDDSLPGTLQMSLYNQSDYPLMDCVFYGRSVKNFSTPQKTIFETRQGP